MFLKSVGCILGMLLYICVHSIANLKKLFLTWRFGFWFTFGLYHLHIEFSNLEMVWSYVSIIFTNWTKIDFIFYFVYCVILICFHFLLFLYYCIVFFCHQFYFDSSFNDNYINDSMSGPLGNELFQKEQADLLSDLKDIPKKACDRKVSFYFYYFFQHL